MIFSKIVMGVMRWGIWGANLSENQVQKLIDTSLQLEIDTFDLADIYGNYTTEALFGIAWKKMDIQRDHLKLISKCGIQLPIENRAKKAYNLSKSYIINQVDQSLQHLKTDYLDLLLLHRPSPIMDCEEIAATFATLRDLGKVKNFGVSNFNASQFRLITRYFPDIIINQIEVSVNNTEHFYSGILEEMMLIKTKPMAWSVLGNYFSQPETAQNKRLKTVLEKLAEKYNVQVNQLLIAFIKKHPSDIIPIIGTTQVKNIIALQKSLSIQLDNQDWFEILEASQGKEVP